MSRTARPRLGRVRVLISLAALSASAVATYAAVPGAQAAPAASAASAACPWVGSTAPIPQRVSQLLAAMTLNQKVQLMTGSSGSSYVGFTPAIGSLCIPAMNLEDGPAGVADGMTNVTQLPAPVDVAATFDTSAEQSFGQLIGAEEAAKGTTVDLGPTINIVRDPRWGRAFESVGEDPYLNGQMGAADIRGVQSTGTMAQVKHLVAYNQETNRNSPSDNVIASNQTLEEIYDPAFQTSVQKGAASSVMCSYSTINGTYACQNPTVLNTVLRNQFGFGGFVTSDWGATHAGAASVNAGLDQDMPGDNTYYGSALISAVNSGQVSQATINTAVSRILTEEFAFGMFDKPPTGSPGATATSSANQTAGEHLAEQGTVLLKNSGNVLPFGSGDTSIAVIGADASTNVQSAGGGSASVNSSGTVTPLQGITSAAPAGTTVSYDSGSSTSSAAALAGRSSVAVVFVSTNESEGSDLSGIDLSSANNSLISAVANANPNTVVVLNTGSAVTMPWLSSVKGVLEAWYPGQSDGTAIARILYGTTNPSGHLPVTFPTSLSQVPASTSAQWPGTNGQVQYSEGVDVGYRWYDSKGLTPLFPFGYGLSYTSFSYSNLQISSLPQGGAATVTATVTNTGSRAGADVAQLYVSDPAASGQPPRQLEGFARVNLQPGQSQTVSFPLTEQNLHYWSTSTNNWATSTGNYGVAVGDADSASALTLSGTLAVAANQLGQPVSVTNPGPQEGVAGAAVSVQVTAGDTTAGQTAAFTAAGLPAGLAISSSGKITGTPITAGTSTVDVTAKDGNGATATTSFVWTVAASSGGVPTTPLVGYQGLCLDVAAANNADGTAVQVYTCNGTNSQQWTEEADGTVHSLGKCLDIAAGGTANGTAVDLYTCNGSGAQQWQPQTNGTLRNPASGRCLDDTGSGLSGTKTEIYDCSGAANQVWKSPAGTSTGGGGGSTGPITGYQGMCVDVRSANSADGTPVQVYTCNGTTAQQWTVESNGSLQALGKCLDVNAAGTANGSLVQLYTCNGTVAQVWQAQSNGELVNPHSGRCLDDTASGGSGTQLQIWDCTASANQKWQLP
ncbi:glycoside hydrolase family 3 domain protein [Catenulispora acidiphila DSM 44928]|uniref:Glycoside hydrolase family 3 domain protein n=1 Tax=Catenulispora acidiphila (strain DSM 44928 / JCM 14897 / NBRC 102108 / NRRL B-24433 / ID139908) TaxID=479433 RepID=C7QGB8_CATAD|nr:glycoside hydrolase family 3 C-terminal domain-containing protein [Catenulispora acidiphila]ACU72963.1 glycoside hydrolase family 3 domain protein [Catenulispora acidiphila DSM 44928]